VPRVGKAGEVKGVLVSGSCDDGVYFTAQGEPDGRFDGMAGDTACTNDAIAVSGGVSTAHAPDTNRYPTLRRNVGDLIFRTHQGDVGFQGFDQRARGNLGADAAGITQGYGQARPAVRS
jgi:hypothetical protein